MEPSQVHKDAGAGASNFEDQVRRLFLSNGGPVSSSTSNAAEAPNPPGQNFSPHMLPANAAIQQENRGPFSQHPFESDTHPTVASNSTNIGHKRPNQAQRRQMNSQLSIPIDSRPLQGTQAGRGTFSPQMQGHWNPSSHNTHPQIHQNQRYNHHQQYSPRFQNPAPNSPYSPYSPRSPYQQGSPGSPMTPYQPGPSPQFQPRSGPNSFHNQASQNSYSRPPPQSRQLYQPGAHAGARARLHVHNVGEVSSQGAELEALLLEIVPDIGISEEEELEKEAFRAVIEGICRSTISEYEKQELANSSFDKSSVEVQCFGSMKSGFATKASDMDLALISPKSNPAPDSPDSAIPRLLEQKLLELGYGARLLTRTRVPIIKLCQKPTQKLHSLLTLERAKWESGFIADADDDHLDPQTPLMEEGKEKEVIVGDVVPVEDGIRESEELDFISKLAHMKQKEHQSLGDYYSVAKRILRKVGGRDITPGAEEISDGEGKILNKVCKAFILGLFDPFLVNRLRSYSSIQPLFDSSLPPLQRTLHGIWIQIDGERLALGWSDRSMLGVDEKLEAEAEEVVNAWRTLQNKSGPMTDSLLYNRQLITASARLKGNILLRLLFLEQIVHEDPVFYYGRAKKLMESLQSHQIVNADSLSDDSFHLNVINRYILGISNPKISKALSQLIGNKDSNNATLEEIGFHHRILQLASDYEHALQVGFYDENHQVDLGHIQSYIKLLRKLELRGKHASNEEDAQLVEKIKSLPDPTKISTSKARDRYQDHLEFPKSGVGIQCDINFSAQLAIHNTLLLRCYSQCDPRVRPMILFVKHWAKVRGINTPYRGTLSSYGYVLMVLHFLVNIASPFVLPNLQDIKKDPPPHLSPQDIEARSMCNGRDVRFWRNEMEIRDLAGRKMLNHNHDSSGLLLRGFFEYYAQTGPMSTVQSRGFDWGREVLSLRTQGGILTKQEKGWVGAKTVVETSTVVAPPTPSVVRQMEFNGEPQNSPSAELQEVQTPRLPVKTMEETKEVRHRYLFAIEDPFELDHNVARTVTHNGIVSIRDEFRRAWRIITGNKMRNVGSGLLDPISNDESKADFLNLLDLIHGPQRQASSSVPQTANIEQPMSS